MYEDKILDALLRIEKLMKKQKPTVVENDSLKEKSIYTTKDMAEMLECHEDTIRRNCRQGKIPHKKFAGRFHFPREAIKKWLIDSEENWERPLTEEYDGKMFDLREKFNA